MAYEIEVGTSLDGNDMWAVGYGHAGVQKSPNSGDSWIDMTNNLPDDYVRCLAIDNSRDWIWCGTSHPGIVFHSEDGGLQWDPYYQLWP